jgi:hypothetical protein
MMVLKATHSTHCSFDPRPSRSIQVYIGGNEGLRHVICTKVSSSFCMSIYQTASVVRRILLKVYNSRYKTLEAAMECHVSSVQR